MHHQLTLSVNSMALQIQIILLTDFQSLCCLGQIIRWVNPIYPWFGCSLLIHNAIERWGHRVLLSSYFWGCEQDTLGMASTRSNVFCFCVQYEWDILMGTEDKTVNRTYKHLHSWKFYSNERRQENKWKFCQRDYSLEMMLIKVVQKLDHITGLNLRGCIWKKHRLFIQVLNMNR